MLLSKDAIADVLERLRPGDFYRPAHQNVYDAILDLYGRGEPADAVTVAAELDRRGLLRADRWSAVSAHADLDGADRRQRRVLRGHRRGEGTAASPRGGGHAGRAVRLRRRGGRRRRRDRGPRAGRDLRRDRAAARTEDFVALEQLLQPTMDEIDAIASQGGLARGVPTGFTELDELTNGLHPGQMIVIAARPGMGKALKLDTPLPTPTGWTTMGEVAVGDQLIGADGKPTRVVGGDGGHGRTAVLRGRVLGWHGHRRRRGAPVAHRHASVAEVGAGRGCRIQPRQEPAHVRRCSHDPRDRRDACGARPRTAASTTRSPTPRRCRGRSATCSSRRTPWVRGWATAQPRPPRSPLRIPRSSCGSRRKASSRTHRRPRSTAINCGCPRHRRWPRVIASCADAIVRPAHESGSDVRSHVRWTRALHVGRRYPRPRCAHCGGPSCGLRLCQECRNAVGTLQARLRTIGVLGNKHIPIEYLRASEAQRRALLAGLLDTDGTVTAGGSVQFCRHQPPACGRRRRADGQPGIPLPDLDQASQGALAQIRRSPTSLNFSTDDEVFGLHRKALLHKERRQPRNSPIWLQVHRRRPACRERASALRPGRQRRPHVPGWPGHGADAQLHSGLGFLAVVLDQEPDAERHVQSGDEQVRDRDAAAVRRGEDQACRHALGPDE